MEWYESKYQFNFPTVVRFGKGVSEEIGPWLVEEGVRTPLIVTDPILKDLEFFKQLVGKMEGAGTAPHVFFDISKNPVKSDVEKGVKAYKESKCDGVVGIGGGASMDTARAIALMVNHSGDLFEYEEAVGGDAKVTNAIPPFITVPTTAGTGSEVGRSAVISDDKTHQKKIFFHPSLLAKRVFADPELTMELPRGVTAATGMDALVHNIEAYLANGFHPMCDGIALEAIRLISQGLPVACNAPDLQSRTFMMAGALMGAVAFQKGLGLVHSCAHSLSTHFDLHHGLANAVMLPYCMEFNGSNCKDKFKAIGPVIGVPSMGTDDFRDHLFELNTDLGIPTNLGAFSINEKNIEALAKTAFDDPCHPLGPKPVQLADFMEIYNKAL